MGCTGISDHDPHGTTSKLKDAFLSKTRTSTTSCIQSHGSELDAFYLASSSGPSLMVCRSGCASFTMLMGLKFVSMMLYRATTSGVTCNKVTYSTRTRQYLVLPRIRSPYINLVPQSKSFTPCMSRTLNVLVNSCSSPSRYWRPIFISYIDES